jgi:hypothetical protein
MLNQTSTKLNPEQLAHFEKHGYYFPVRVFEETEATELGTRFLNYFKENWESIKDLTAREHQTVLIETHTFLNWAYRLRPYSFPWRILPSPRLFRDADQPLKSKKTSAW